jgi:hypothetical protein
MRLRSVVALPMVLALALIGGSRSFGGPMMPRVAGGETKCVADNSAPPAVTSEAPACRRGGGATRSQLPQVWPMAAASAWEAFPAPGLSAAVRPQFPFTHGFANTGAGPTVTGAKLDGRLVAPQAGQSEPTPKLSFTGDVGIPNNHTLDDVLRQQYRGPARWKVTPWPENL